MRKLLPILVFALAALLAPAAFACHAQGYVWCDVNQNGVIDADDTPFANAVILIENTAGTFETSGSTGDDGYYYITLPDPPDTYVLTIDPASIPADAIFVVPPSGQFLESITDADQVIHNEWLIDSELCQPELGKCWMTGGGAKFETVTGTYMAEKGPQHTFGGNVNPSCSAEPGDGGSWNHVAHPLKLHFHGQSIRVVQCGNIAGIPPGSTSPKTPFNFIEFTGTGTLKGIKGNKADFGTVFFFGHVEDRNEPGSAGAKDGAKIDRYFLQVFTNLADPAGSTVLLIDLDGVPATVDPVTITGGNLQLHVTSCN